MADTERLVIDHVGHHGDGVAMSGGSKIYVPYTLGGETVDVAPVPVIEREGAGRVKSHRIDYVGAP